MTSRYDELLEKHQALQKEEQAEATPERIERVKTFIAEIVEAGKSVSDARQREQLRGLLRYWGAWVYDHTKEYPQAQLAPALIAYTKAEEGRRAAIQFLGGERNAAIAGGVILLLIVVAVVWVGSLFRGLALSPTSAPDLTGTVEAGVAEAQATEVALTAISVQATQTAISVPTGTPVVALDTPVPPTETAIPRSPTITPSPTPTPTPTPGPSPTPGVVMMLQGHTDVVRALAFSPDGAVLASGGLDGTVRMWDVARLTPKHESPFAADQWIFSLVFSSNGSRLFIGTGLGLQGGGKLGVLDVEQNLLLLSTDKIFIDNVTSVTLDRFGTRLATGSIGSATDDDTVSLALWQPDSLSRVARYSDNPILALAFSSDGNRLVYGGTDRNVYIRDLQTSKRITGPVKHNGFVRGVAFSPDDTLVVSVSEDGTARLWNAANLSPLATLQKNAVRVFAVAFSPDGRQLAAAGVSLDGQGLIELWDVEAARQGGPVEPFVLTYPVTKANQTVSQQNALAFRALAFSPDGRWLAASGDDPTVILWSVR